MTKMLVSDVFECNKVLDKIMKQRTLLPISVGLKINKIMKEFDEVEEYVLKTMDVAFGEIDWTRITKEQMQFYNTVLSQEIEIDFEKIPREIFENNDKVMLSIEDVDKLTLILT